MPTQITCEDLPKIIKEYPGSYLIDVRTEKEWNDDGKPDGSQLGLTTYFLSYMIDQPDGRIVNPDFKKKIKEFEINKDKKVIVMCKSRARSAKAALILEQMGFDTYNILNGFVCSEDVKPSCWKTTGLPVI